MNGVIYMVIETERLILREMSFEDFDSLKAIISNPINMKYYEQPYDDNGVTRWINWNLTNLISIFIRNKNMGRSK
jgi:RimJ/RimL family protein N-acetyltransferase